MAKKVPHNKGLETFAEACDTAREIGNAARKGMLHGNAAEILATQRQLAMLVRDASDAVMALYAAHDAAVMEETLATLKR